MPILITGSRGRIGRMLTTRWSGMDVVGVDVRDGDLTRSATPGHYAAVVALAAAPDGQGPFETAWAGNMAILTNTLRVATDRIVFASSIWTEHAAWGLSPSLTWYAAAKLAGELAMQAWAAERATRSAVALRIGGYDPGAADEPAFRVDDTTLTQAFDAALSAPAGFHIRYAVGTRATGLGATDMRT